MKKPLFLLAGALLGAPFLTAAEAQIATTETVAPIDATAMARLDAAAAAYKALNGLSMRYSAIDTQGEKVTRTSGTIAFERPARARIAESSGENQKPFLLNSADAKSAEDTANRLRMAMARLSSPATVPLVFFVNGDNPLSTPTVLGTTLKWTNVKALPDEGVSMTTGFGGRTVTFNLYFDPTDHLLRRVEAKSTIAGAQGLNITTLTEVQANPTFAADTFGPQTTDATQAAAARPAAERTYYDPKLVVGAMPYALTGADLMGKAVSLPAYKGKVVLLDFWATWCGPCIGELPNVLASYKKYKAQGFDIIGVSLDEDKTALTSFIKARQMPWPQLFDGKVWKNVNSTRYGVRAIPFTLLIGKDGRIAAVNPRGGELEPAIKKALAG